MYLRKMSIADRSCGKLGWKSMFKDFSSCVGDACQCSQGRGRTQRLTDGRLRKSGTERTKS